MARETHERTIGPYLYRVTLLGAKAGHRMAWKLAKLVAPSATMAADGLVAAQTAEPMAALALGAAWGINRLIELIDPAELELMQMELAKLTEVLIDAEHEPNLAKVFDDHFAGHYDWLREWFAFALEVNFTSFFGDTASGSVTQLAGKLQSLMRSLLPPQPSTPPTGASTASSQATSTEAQA